MPRSPRTRVLLIRAALLALVVLVAGDLTLSLVRDSRAMVARVRASALKKPAASPSIPNDLPSYLERTVAQAWKPSWGLPHLETGAWCDLTHQAMACVNVVTVNGLVVQFRSADGINLRASACFPLAEANRALAVQRLADAQEPARRPEGLPQDIVVQRLLRAPGRSPAPDRNLLLLNGTPMVLLRRPVHEADALAQGQDCLSVEVPAGLTEALLFAEANLPLQPVPTAREAQLGQLLALNLDPLTHQMPPGRPDASPAPQKAATVHTVVPASATAVTVRSR